MSYIDQHLFYPSFPWRTRPPSLFSLFLLFLIWRTKLSILSHCFTLLVFHFSKYEGLDNSLWSKLFFDAFKLVLVVNVFISGCIMWTIKISRYLPVRKERVNRPTEDAGKKHLCISENSVKENKTCSKISKRWK